MRTFGAFGTVDIHFAVDIPQNVDYGSLRRRLIQFISDGKIEVEEAFIADQHKDQIDS